MNENECLVVLAERLQRSQETLRRAMDAVSVSASGLIAQKNLGAQKNLVVAKKRRTQVCDAIKAIVELQRWQRKTKKEKILVVVRKRRAQVCDAINAIEELQRWRRKTEKPRKTERTKHHYPRTWPPKNFQTEKEKLA